MTDRRKGRWDSGTAWHLACVAHKGQVDRAGEPYILHPSAVATRVSEQARALGMTREQVDVLVQAAWLHDVVEDTHVTLDMLRALGCSGRVVQLVDLLTRTADVSSREYYARIAADEDARLIKLADIEHNVTPERLDRLPEHTRLRLIHKYRDARVALGFFDRAAR